MEGFIWAYVGCVVFNIITYVCILDVWEKDTKSMTLFIMLVPGFNFIAVIFGICILLRLLLHWLEDEIEEMQKHV